MTRAPIRHNPNTSRIPKPSNNPVFFFQAEDGIRDLTVTGVQTCALPISRFTAAWHWRSAFPARAPGSGESCRATEWRRRARSEERRVGKECRCRWLQCHLERERTKTVTGVGAWRE